MTTLTARTAIVTGASRGIGAAIARRLARDGITILVNYRTGQAEAEEVIRDIEAQGGAAMAVQGDLADPSAPASLFDAAEQAFGGVDILVNNAAVSELGEIADFDDARFEAQVALNLGGVFRGMREGARRLRDGGRIINLSSTVVGTYQPRYGVYAATKAAVEALTHVAAKELGSRGITVNAVSPGPIETALFLTGKSAAQVQSITQLIPLGRLGQPEDVSGLIAFLASPDGGWVNGQVIRANGGVI